MLGDWLGQLAAWLAKAIGLMSAEAWYGYLSNGLKAAPVLAASLWAWRGFAKWRAPYGAPSPRVERFNILVADLTGDKRQVHRRLLCKALEEWSLREKVPLQVYALRRRIEDRDFLGDEGRARVAAEVQSWLNETGYDVLIWGVWLEAVGALPSYSLRFAARDFGFLEASKLSIPAYIAYTLWKMEVLVSLPKTLPKDVGDVVAVAAGNFLTAAGNLEGDKHKEVLSKAIKKAINVLDVEPAVLSAGTRATLRDQVLQSISESIGDLSSDELPAYGTWVEKQMADAPKVDSAYWRATRNTLEIEIALRRDDTTEALAAILELRRERARDVKREAAPTEWGIAQYELGQILAAIGGHTSDRKFYVDAIEALDNSLPSLDPDEVPELLEHALLLLAGALNGYGQEALTDDALVRSIVISEGLLQRQTKRSKMLRSRVLSELASAHTMLGLRQNGTKSLQTAAATYERATVEFSVTSNSKVWWSVLYGHGVVLFYIGSRAPDVSSLDQAKAKFEYLLEHYPKDSDIDRWAPVTSSLANVYAAIGRTTGSAEAFGKAIKVYQSAIDVIPAEEVSHWSLVRENLGGVLRILGVRTGNLTYLEEAELLSRSAVEVLSKDSMPHQWIDAQMGLARALLDRGRQMKDVTRLREAAAICEVVVRELSAIQNEHSRSFAVNLLEECRAALAKQD